MRHVRLVASTINPPFPAALWSDYEATCDDGQATGVRVDPIPNTFAEVIPPPGQSSPPDEDDRPLRTTRLMPGCSRRE